MDLWNTETESVKLICQHSKAVQDIILISKTKFVTCSDDKTVKLFMLNSVSDTFV